MEPRKICVIHLNQIGDLVFSLPLLKALKDNYPQAQIHSVTRPYLKELLVDSPYVDEIILREKGLVNGWRLLKNLRRNRYDLLISLSNSGGGLFLAAWSKAAVKAGFTSFPWDLWLDVKDEITGHHSWRHNLRLLEKLGLEVKQDNYVGLLELAQAQVLKDIKGLESFDLSGGYAVISAGTSLHRKVKSWQDEKFAEVIRQLKKQYGFNAVLVGGADNIETNERIIESVSKGNNGGDLVNLAGKTGLKDLCYILKAARIFVGVDSGLMHLASSLDIPVVALFGPTDPFYVGPLNKQSVVIQKKALECVPCYLKGCEKRICMSQIEVEEVMDACKRLLFPFPDS